MRRVKFLLHFFTVVCYVNWAGAAIDLGSARTWAYKHNMTAILVFGDSTVDPGNNNHLSTSMKSNFLPYGMDFFNGKPSGRFCNGRLATDFIAEALGYESQVRAFLDLAIGETELLHGVSFASAASGYDELTANLSNVISISKQLEYFRHYKLHLRKLVGIKEAEEVVHNALFIMSMGTNDLIQNYYTDPTRSKQFTIEQYLDYLVLSMKTTLKSLSSLGARRVAVVGVPPFGCLPLVRTFRGETKCDEELNKVAFSFNNKIQLGLKSLKKPWFTTLYVDIYQIIEAAFNNHTKYGFTETMKGCCGSGMYEYGQACKDVEICSDRTKYIFWDAVHPTEAMYKIIAERALEMIYSPTF